MHYYQASKLHEVFNDGKTSDPQRLKLLNIFLRDQVAEAHKATQCRRDTLHRIATLAEGGKVALVNGGMDCDCAKWANSVTLVKATPAAVDKWVERFYHWAEGPQWCYIERPSVARKLKEEHRDLALEAFEDGHPHVVFA
jgi:hypothetical protein